MQAHRPIHSLPDEVISQIRSSLTTPSFPHCIEELVLNSLDANATCIAVRVDLESLKVQVVDNGYGIVGDDLKIVGQRYATSKCYGPEDLGNLAFFGFRGEFLASLSKIASVLEVISRPQNEKETLTKLFRKGKIHDICGAKEARPAHGSTVTAYNMYYNLPVRQKNINVAIDLERIRKCLEALAIIYHQVSFSLRDDCTGSKIIQTHFTKSMKSAFGFLFGHTKSNILSEVHHAHKTFTVRGYVGIECHANKSLQFIYVNKRPVHKTKIHKIVNKYLAHSLLLKSQKGENDQQSPVQKDFLSLCNQTSPKTRTQGEYAVYILDIRCLRTEYDILPDPSQTFLEFQDWAGVSSCIEKALHKFLVDQNLLLTVSATVEDTGDASKELFSDSDDDELIGPVKSASPVSPSNLKRLQRFGYNINTANLPNNLQSRIVTRAHLIPGLPVKNGECSREDSDIGELRDGGHPKISDEIPEQLDNGSPVAGESTQVSQTSCATEMLSSEQEGVQEHNAEEGEHHEGGGSVECKMKSHELMESEVEQHGDKGNKLYSDRMWFTESQDQQKHGIKDVVAVNPLSVQRTSWQNQSSNESKVDNHVIVVRDSEKSESLIPEVPSDSEGVVSDKYESISCVLPSCASTILSTTKANVGTLETGRQKADGCLEARLEHVLHDGNRDGHRKNSVAKADGCLEARLEHVLHDGNRDGHRKNSVAKADGCLEARLEHVLHDGNRDGHRKNSVAKADGCLEARLEHVLHDGNRDGHRKNSVAKADGCLEARLEHVLHDGNRDGHRKNSVAKADGCLEARLEHVLHDGNRDGHRKNSVAKADGCLEARLEHVLHDGNRDGHRKNSVAKADVMDLSSQVSSLGLRKRTPIKTGPDRHEYEGQHSSSTNQLINTCNFDAISCNSPRISARDVDSATPVTDPITRNDKWESLEKHHGGNNQTVVAEETNSHGDSDSVVYVEHGDDLQVGMNQSQKEYIERPEMKTYMSSLQRFKNGLKCGPTHVASNNPAQSTCFKRPSHLDESVPSSKQPKQTSVLSELRSSAGLRSHWFPDVGQRMRIGQKKSPSSHNSKMMSCLSQKLARLRACRAGHDEHVDGTADTSTKPDEELETSKREQMGKEEDIIQVRETSVGCQTSPLLVAETRIVNQNRMHMHCWRDQPRTRELGSHQDNQDITTEVSRIKPAADATTEMREIGKPASRQKLFTSDVDGTSTPEPMNSERNCPDDAAPRKPFLCVSDVERNHVSESLRVVRVCPALSPQPFPHFSDIKEIHVPECSRVKRVCPYQLEGEHHKAKKRYDSVFLSTGSFVQTAKDLLPRIDHSGPTGGDWRHVSTSESSSSMQTRTNGHNKNEYVRDAQQTRNLRSGVRVEHETIGSEQLQLPADWGRLRNGKETIIQQRETCSMSPQYTTRTLTVSSENSSEEPQKCRGRNDPVCSRSSYEQQLSDKSHQELLSMIDRSFCPMEAKLVRNPVQREEVRDEVPFSGYQDRDISELFSTERFNPRNIVKEAEPGLVDHDSSSQYARDILVMNTQPFQVFPEACSVSREKHGVDRSSDELGDADCEPGRLPTPDDQRTDDSVADVEHMDKRLQQHNPVGRIHASGVRDVDSTQPFSELHYDGVLESAKSQAATCSNEGHTTWTSESDAKMKKNRSSGRDEKCENFESCPVRVTDRNNPKESAQQVIEPVSSQLSRGTLNALTMISDTELESLTVIESPQEQSPPLDEYSVVGSSQLSQETRKALQSLSDGELGKLTIIEGSPPDFGIVRGSQEELMESDELKEMDKVGGVQNDFSELRGVLKYPDELLRAYICDSQGQDGLHREVTTRTKVILAKDHTISLQRVPTCSKDAGADRKTDEESQDADLTRAINSADRGARECKKKMVTFQDPLEGRSPENTDSRKPSTADGITLKKGTSKPLPWELFWFLPKSAKDFFPCKPQERQAQAGGQEALNGSAKNGTAKLIEQHLTDVDKEAVAIKWKEGPPAEAEGPAKSVDDIFDNWRNPIFETRGREVLNATQALSATVKVHNSIHPYHFTKDIFESIQVIGQLDNKFVACLVDPSAGAGEMRQHTPHLLVLVDQHAAHERIRLEQLTHEAYQTSEGEGSFSDDGSEDDSKKCCCLRSTPILPVPLHISNNECRLAQAYSDKLERFGVVVSIEKRGKAYRAEVTSLPTCLVEPEKNLGKRAKQSCSSDLAEALVQECVHLLQETAGSCGVLPRTITRSLNSQACRGAIKFGDPLCHNDMVLLLSQLSECALPFQCAHGRPSIIPLLDLNHLYEKLHPKDTEKESYLPKLSRLRENLDAGHLEP